MNDDWDDEELDPDLALSIDSGHRTLYAIAAAIWAAVTLAVAADGAMTLTAAFLVFAAYLARQAVASQRRCDSIHARALAAELAEGADDPETWAEAA